MENSPAIFPLHRISPDGHCPCGNADPDHRQGKCPNGRWGDLVAGEQRPAPEGCGYGIATGARSGFFVVDLDVKPEKGIDGVRAFADLAAGRTFSTHTTLTGNGKGLHLRFQCPKDFEVRNSQSKLGPGIDVRGEGGYIVGPGSPHESGGVYRVVIDVPVAPAPDWLIEALRAGKATKHEAPSAAQVAASSGGGKLLSAAKLLGDNWPTTGRHPAQNALAGALVRGGWSREDCVEFLCKVCEIAGNEDPVKRTQTVADAFAKKASGEAYTGFGELRKLIEPAIVDAARKLMGLSDDAGDVSMLLGLGLGATKDAVGDGDAPHARRKHDPSHVYTHVTGQTLASSDGVKKRPLSDIVHVLCNHSAWAGVWQYDEMKRTLIAVDPPMKLDAETTGLSDSDMVSVRLWFETLGVLLLAEDVKAAIHAAAKARSFHPVREYLGSLPKPANICLLDTLALRVFGQADPMAQIFLKKFLIAAVRRALVPGTKVDTMLVLYSAKEGRFKSTFVEALFGAQWFRDQMPSLEGRDASHALEGFWGVEIGELDQIMKVETSTTKDFLSRRTDKYRQFGNGQKVEHKRECVFIGTTNYPDFLKSDTGNRRFWPIEIIGMLDLQFVLDHRDTIWAEAQVLAMLPMPAHGEKEVPGVTCAHWLSEDEEGDAAKIRDPHDQRDPWHELVEDYCAGQEEEVNATDIYLQKICAGDTGAAARVTLKEIRRIGGILRKSGCTDKVAWRNGKSVRVWTVGDRLKTMAPTADELRRREVKRQTSKHKTN